MKRPARILVVDDEFGMVRAVERVLGGTLTVHSELRAGTRVLVTVPWASSTT